MIYNSLSFCKVCANIHKPPNDWRFLDSRIYSSFDNKTEHISVECSCGWNWTDDSSRAGKACHVTILADKTHAILPIEIPNSLCLVLGVTRSPCVLANGLRLFSTESACCVGCLRYVGLCIRGLRGQSEEALLFIDIPNSRGLERGETRSSYLIANVSREQLTFRSGLWNIRPTSGWQSKLCPRAIGTCCWL